ncbi:MAG: tyrosine-type recombinase/integrase [Pegethrix bostrychoides GSE-TBD4-15B]|jgi:integrase/recombinase XerD|uniref:Tyrosine-type recombinase/integrase n=1 Tax=Pegethrix bostrychoides GSE-TBD4-15B TaxID=2839662 RepID=A0A951P9M6_9CYAN|nr:tyrosine-type recombinase/integrase [Pegethrix bostrychoides GSE-TBD4-15B]
MVFTLARVATKLLDAQGLSPKTKKSYEGVLLPLLQKLGQTPIDQIKRADLEEYFLTLTHVGYRTHNKHQTIITRLFNFAIEQGYLEANPISHLKPKKPDATQGEYSHDEPVRYLSKKEIEALYKATQSFLRLDALVSLLHESGARISEVLALDLKDINFSEREFRVVGKGNKKRWCYFGDRSHRALSHYINGNREHPHEALFTERMAMSHKIRRLTYDSSYREWKVALNDCPDLKSARFHDLRHTFATERAKVIPIEVLRALLGHENIQTTLIYQKITSQVAKEVAHNALKNLRKSC